MADLCTALFCANVSDEKNYILGLLQGGGWDELNGSLAEKTTSDKLHRAENMRLEKPFIKFELERHHGNANGSSRSGLHRWKINLKEGKAEIESRSYRQTEPRDKTFKATERADEVSKEILNGEDKAYLIWNDSKTECKIKIVLLIPETNQQTTLARRRRFRNNLNEILESEGWQQTRKTPYLAFIKTVKTDHL